MDKHCGFFLFSSFRIVTFGEMFTIGQECIVPSCYWSVISNRNTTKKYTTIKNRSYIGRANHCACLRAGHKWDHKTVTALTFSKFLRRIVFSAHHASSHRHKHFLSLHFLQIKANIFLTSTLNVYHLTSWRKNSKSWFIQNSNNFIVNHKCGDMFRLIVIIRPIFEPYLRYIK